MTKVQYKVVYPSVKRAEPDPSDEEIWTDGVLNIGCDKWMTDENIRLGFCERIFSGMNRGSTVEFPWFLESKLRSMSVGDIVYFPDTDEYFVCESCGFSKFTTDEAYDWLVWEGRQYGCCSFELNKWRETSSLFLRSNV